MSENKYYRGQIYYVYPKDYTGCEQGGGRPAVIVSNDVGNEYSKVVEVVFLTTREKKPLPTHVAINSAKYPSTALCEQIDTVDKERIGGYINEVTQAELKNIEKALLVSFGISCSLKGSKALEAWRKLMEDYQEEEICEEPEVDNISIQEKTGEAEKKKETAEITAPNPIDGYIDLEAAPEYIRMKAERDVYKELYMNLLQMKRQYKEEDDE